MARGALKLAAPATPLPVARTFDALREAAAGCRACELWRRGTQTVFGEGGRPAAFLFVGEQPGNEEDLTGRPFVGPAGRLLDEALQEAGIDGGHAYVTNVVKHFKWEPRGKRRIHAKPNAAEISACLPWLQAEIEVAQPRVIVCLGATAAQALLGREFRVTRDRGHPVPSPLAAFVMATVHPSTILRAPDAGTRRAETARFIADLKVAAAIGAPGAPAASPPRVAAATGTPANAPPRPRRRTRRASSSETPL